MRFGRTREIAAEQALVGINDFRSPGMADKAVDIAQCQPVPSEKIAQHGSELGCDQARDIAQVLNQIDKEDQKHWLDALLKLKGNDLLEEHHIQELRDFILQQLKNRQKQEQFLDELIERAVGQNAD